MSIRSRLRPVFARLRRFIRREIVDVRRWIEHTRNFIHISLLLLMPVLIGLVTFVSNRLDLLPFLMFPPLASGAYTLFANPGSKYATPRRFVAGMSAGAFCGWAALEISTRYWYTTGSGLFYVDPIAAALGVFLTGVVTWGGNFEESQAFSTALLVLVVGVSQLTYVVSVFLSASVVAGVFYVWRDRIYEQRAEYLYRSTRGDDAVLIPIRGDDIETVMSFGAQIAAAHEAGKVVLVEVVDTSADGDEIDTETSQERSKTADEDTPPAVRQAAERLETYADEASERFDVPCEVVVIDGDPDDGQIITRAAKENSCDLIVTPYETADGKLSQFVRQLFASDFDVVVFRGTSGRETWHRILVPVKYAGGVAHTMLDFADRLASDRGRTTICHSIDSENRRREAESMLADLAETFDRAFETRVMNRPIEDVIAEQTAYHDLTVVGSSSDRTFVSRAIHPPTFKQLDDCDCDIAIVHRI
jgi:nucleotide-binding universal stress UspA family protein